jgi:hypothetical protein
VSPKLLNLSVLAPVVLPQFTTSFAMSTVGMLITHSLDDFSRPYE